MSTLLRLGFMALGAFNAVAGLYSIRASLRYRAYVRKAALASGGERGAGAAPPEVLLIVPCCGEEEDLERNLESLLAQSYPSFRVRFAVESRSDGALPVIDRLIARHRGKVELVIAGPAAGEGQKVRNLLAALEDREAVEVLAFADSDGRPEADWLLRLVRPLESSAGDLGATSSYRFYLPEPATFSTLLRSVWNASVLTLLGDHDRNFAWGGSMAIRADVFERIGVAEAWRGALSDDYALTHAVRDAGLRVEFVPGAMIESRGKVGFLELCSWSARQIQITRVYWPSLFRVAGATNVLYAAFLVLAPLEGSPAATTLLGLVLLGSLWSGRIRARAIADLVPRFRSAIRRRLWAYTILAPLGSLLTVQGVVRALASRRVEWRGKVYEMISPRETSILER
jgi:cellulose synthase/poly-beta-1,6-N-acetylglucosamine synthase-like glycosyltransferase